MAVEEDVYCTLVMTDAYLPGAAVLAHSLRDAGTTHKLACLITPETLQASTVTALRSLYDYVLPIDRIGNPHPANLYLMNRPDLLYTFTKIHLWRLTQFRKVIYIDSDVVALRAPEELFKTVEEFAAAPDVGWPDAFNTGVMVISPHMGEYWALRTLASAGDSFDGADQGLLNQYFEHRGWKRLPFTYNCTPSANYQYEPAYRYNKKDISMVHFIGGEKPWLQGRAGAGAMKGKPAGAYGELVGRWWAVYDRHYRVPTSASGRTVQREVKGETAGNGDDSYATGYSATSAPPALTTAAETPFTEPTDQAQDLDQGLLQPTPTAQQRKFSAPTMDWDATRAAPPSASRPEASNFPSQIYEFNTGTELFRPPASYPEPPRDQLWYDVPAKAAPKKEAERLKPIFPWEEREAPKPSRTFIDEEPPLPPPQPEAEEDEDDFAGADELAVSSDDWAVEPKTPAVKVNNETPWSAFGSASKNAWDEVSGIDDYVRALTLSQKSRGPKPQLVHQATAQHHSTSIHNPSNTHVLSPSNEPEPAELIDQVKKRRESLILTDFPSAVERPSLPVTPAPRRRPTFWGQDRESGGELPPADGVVDQVDWNPNDQLEQLRRNSLLGPGDLKLPDRKKSIPNRTMPSSSAPIPEEELPTALEPDGPPVSITSGGASPHGLDMDGPSDAADKNAAKAAPTFSDPIFSAPSSSFVKEETLSPTETRTD